MKPLHDIRFPNESEAYRKARFALLELEVEFRVKAEEAAAARRALPAGGALKEDYLFQEGAGLDAGDPKPVRMSALFGEGRSTLLLYSFMYPEGGNPCPMCTSFLDGLNANAPYIKDRAALAVLARAPVSVLDDWGRARQWNNLRLLSSGGTTFNSDYHAESEAGEQLPILHVFSKQGGGEIYHFWSSEVFFVPSGKGHPRHLDQLWPLWSALDLTPEGRGQSWWPSPEMK